MRRKTIIVLAITFMVTVMVTAFSYLYISQILRQRITNAYETQAASPSNSPTSRATMFPISAARGRHQRSRSRSRAPSPNTCRRIPTLNNMLESDVGLLALSSTTLRSSTPTAKPCCTPIRKWSASQSRLVRTFARCSMPASGSRFAWCRSRRGLRRELSAATQWRSLSARSASESPRFFCKSEITPRLMHAVLFFDRVDFRFAVACRRHFEPRPRSAEGNQPQPR